METNQENQIINESLVYEKSLLGGLFHYQNLEDIETLLTKSDFLDLKYSLLYEAIIGCFKEGAPVDLITINSRLSDKDLKSTLIEVVSGGCMSSQVMYYAEKVKSNSSLRQLSVIAQDILVKSANPESKPDLIVDDISKKVSKIFLNSKNEILTSKEVSNTVMDGIRTMFNNPVAVVGTTTGFTRLDSKLSGLHKSDLIILAARPARGKSSFALQLAKNVALYGKTPVLFFSLEMGNDQLVQRLIASEAKVDLTKIRTGNLSDTEMKALENSSEIISSIPLSFNDKSGVTVKDIRQQIKAYNARNKEKVGLVIVDYLQLMAIGGKENMVTAVTEISRGLKMIAKDFNIPVIALSQLSRGVEARGDRPRLSDLRDSGSIEQDADIVMFLHSKNEDNIYGVKNIELLIEKHRNGALGDIKYEFNGSKMYFNEVDSFTEW